MIEYVQASTTYGPVRGRMESRIPTFRGIPYGSGVAGAGRLRPPAPPVAWTEPLDATVTGPRAVQPHGNLFQSYIGEYFTGGRIGALDLNSEVDSEDCLVLNVLTPATDDARRPVMVYLHGGAFSEGSGVIVLGAQRLPAEQDVVLVSVNHRLNVFGYLYLGDFDEAYADSGNAGTLDLILALEWVRDNIANFGGDPGNVTIFGESGGGAKVSTLLATPAAKGLFHRAIIESGPSLRAKTTQEASAVAREILSRLGIDPSSPSDLSRLTELSAAELVAAVPDSWIALAPVKDGRTLADDPFDPRALANSKGVPLLLGHCDDEMTWLVNLDELDDEIAAGALASMFTASQREDIAAVYGESLGALSPLELYLKVMSDAFVGHNVTQIAERKADNGDDVYRYVFTYRTPVEGGKYGAFHTAELPLVFRHVRYPETEELSCLISAAWAGFARSGDPAQPGLTWPTYDRARRSTAVLDLNARVVEDPESGRREICRRLPAMDPWSDGRWESDPSGADASGAPSTATAAFSTDLAVGAS
jgi:para-nitrobenzyl esterase